MIVRMEDVAWDPHVLNLPDEVLINAFSFLDFRTLRTAVLVCKHFDDLAEPFLYRSIQVLNGRQAGTLATGLHANSRRIPWVRSLLVSTKFGEDEGLTRLPPYIAQMQNLQDLRLETPDCNTKMPEDRVSWVDLQDRYERIFENSSVLIPKTDLRHLPNLRTCTLHFVDGNKELYSMTKYAMLFLHPNLRSLTMSCASTDFPHNLLVPFQDDPDLMKTTALEHLHLEECDIFSASLAILLSFPKCLKSLKISEGTRYDGLFSLRSSRMHGNVAPDAFIDALAIHCRDSLEELSLNLGFFRHGSQYINTPGHHLDLTSFHNIKSLDLECRTVNLIRVRPTCDHVTWKRLPPNLERFRIFGIPLGQGSPFRARPPGRAYFPLDMCVIREKGRHGIRHLKNLIYSYEFYRQDDESSNLSLSDEDDDDDGDEEEDEEQDFHPILGVGMHNPPPANVALAGVGFGGAFANLLHLNAAAQLNQNINHPRPRRRRRDELSQVGVAQNRLAEECTALQKWYIEAKVRLEIEMVVLSNVFIPPYLFPEDTPYRYLFWESAVE